MSYLITEKKNLDKKIVFRFSLGIEHKYIFWKMSVENTHFSHQKMRAEFLDKCSFCGLYKLSMCNTPPHCWRQSAKSALFFSRKCLYLSYLKSLAGCTWALPWNEILLTADVRFPSYLNRMGLRDDSWSELSSIYYRQVLNLHQDLLPQIINSNWLKCNINKSEIAKKIMSYSI